MINKRNDQDLRILILRINKYEITSRRIFLLNSFLRIRETTKKHLIGMPSGRSKVWSHCLTIKIFIKQIRNG